ncbi:flagellar type III secretion system protein FlhB [Candidatus Liberibacter americanus]|uniref:Flagellar biosynthesis protein FlhB n=1 Tax=Candidatus Liberibacter americanus str. Sao Paulo TaxID=1261131 RepID=U6B6Y4_9HYPH|nr:flagellar type III secretion system protein FlhB [Candidatus Liberibacter americanus]AHA27631.1 Flagellar biosynthesis protein FlhB [Candidatus Liberibacter americanus str. Sao Paulo]EMS36340.1 flagellar biosynthesis protein FlhB [Candidatus Liberibacter americanus PW_SP]
MSENDNTDNKKEAPSTKKIEDARKKGNLPISKEVSLLASIIACLIYLLFFIHPEIEILTHSMRDFLEKSIQFELKSSSQMLLIIVNISIPAIKLVLPGLLLFIMFGIGSYLVQGVYQPNLHNIKPSIKKISPLEGIKRIYSKNNLISFIKSFAKIVVIGTLIAIFIKNSYFDMVDSLTSHPQIILNQIFLTIRKILIIIILLTTLITIADLGWTYYQWYSKLKMSKNEVKDEMKQTYGNPLVKSRQRSIARSRLRHQMIEATSRATLVITNPTHYALALRYAQKENDAPIMLAKGQNIIAAKIKEIAQKENIPIFEDPVLARSLFRQVPINSTIPPVFYNAVAQLIHKIYTKNR